MKKELICFDMDNTLVKSNKVHLRGFQRAFEKNHLAKVSDSEVIKYFGLTGEVLVKKLYPELTKEQIKKIVKDHDDLVVKETHKYAKAIPGAVRTLKKLKKTHKKSLTTWKYIVYGLAALIVILLIVIAISGGGSEQSMGLNTNTPGMSPGADLSEL